MKGMIQLPKDERPSLTDVCCFCEKYFVGDEWDSAKRIGTVWACIECIRKRMT